MCYLEKITLKPAPLPVWIKYVNQTHLPVPCFYKLYKWIWYYIILSLQYIAKSKSKPSMHNSLSLKLSRGLVLWINFLAGWTCKLRWMKEAYHFLIKRFYFIWDSSPSKQLLLLIFLQQPAKLVIWLENTN